MQGVKWQVIGMTKHIFVTSCKASQTAAIENCAFDVSEDNILIMYKISGQKEQSGWFHESMSKVS